MCFARGSILGVWRIVWVSSVSVVVHSVSLCVVITLHSEAVSVLGKEIFLLFGFSVTQVWPGCCSCILQLWCRVLDLQLFNIGLGHEHDWLTMCQEGYFHELLVMICSIQDPQRYLPAVSDQGPVYVESFGATGLHTQFYQAIFHCKGLTSSGNTTLRIVHV